MAVNPELQYLANRQQGIPHRYVSYKAISTIVISAELGGAFAPRNKKHSNALVAKYLSTKTTKA